MTANITEIEFVGEVIQWINQIIEKNPQLPFSKSRMEQQENHSTRRRDLTIFDKNSMAVLTGEVKLPFQNEGGSPHNISVVENARNKSLAAKTDFYFTWNVNEFVLWETHTDSTVQRDRNYRSWTVTSVSKSEHLNYTSTINAIQKWWSEFLHTFANILLGSARLGTLSPDEKFIDMLETSLKVPILLTYEALERNYDKPAEKEKLDKWMREQQGWVIYDDPEGIRENLERTAKFACYNLLNKLVFHEALLKRYAARLSKLAVQEHITKADELFNDLFKYFEEAKKVTGDYETVFGIEHTEIGNRIPFYSDSVVPHWRELIRQIHEFDFTGIDYEVIGNIFEKLISPEERHKYGQFYTRPEVVDLINGFCIASGDETILDPACGGGTFLVRAYARKKLMDPTRSHNEMLGDLFGVDVSHFAAHLTTINLATRDLIDDENYPQIVRDDFFNIDRHRTFITFPPHARADGLGKVQSRDVALPLFDAIVGNPPYIRQEDIPRSRDQVTIERGTKEYYHSLIKQETGLKLSGRSDIHCYFWPHASMFLKDGGYLCLLTSSQWLDVEYGFQLQKWILNNFEIVAVFESIDEPWFVGARVVTAATILKKQPDDRQRMNNIARFVQLRRPLSEIFSNDGTTAGLFESVNAFIQEILDLSENTTNQRYRARLVNQRSLWEEGVQLGVVMGKSDNEAYEESEQQIGEYYGGKWGVYLRAPDLWFDLMDRFGHRFVSLNQLVDIRFGIKSGKDVFFFTRDVSTECLSKEKDPASFRELYGASRQEVAAGKVKLVRCGKGYEEIRPIESEFLEPEVHSLMEISGYTVDPKDCSRMILLVNKQKKDLQGLHVLDYIKWGEKNNYHTGSTCAARVSKTRQWYDLTGHKKGELFWPKAQQYKHIITVNSNNLFCSNNLYDVTLNDGSVYCLAGILNSTLVVLSKYQYGRPVGVEGNLKTEVIDVSMMPVPDPRGCDEKTRKKVELAFAAITERTPLRLLSERRLKRMALIAQGKESELETLSDLSEFDMQDRRKLDDVVLEMIGVSSAGERKKIIDELYDYLRRYFELTRQKEEKAIANKKKYKKRTRVSPREIAGQILDEIRDIEPRLLRSYDPDFIDTKKPFDTYDLPKDGTPEVHSDIFTSHGVAFKKGRKGTIDLIETKVPEQDELIVLVAESGIRGLVRIPHDAEECNRILGSYRRFIEKRNERLRELIEKRSSDTALQEKISNELLSMLGAI